MISTHSTHNRPCSSHNSKFTIQNSKFSLLPNELLTHTASFQKLCQRFIHSKESLVAFYFDRCQVKIRISHICRS